jgi:class 3 adenylate cyclase/predicted ATPase
VEFDEILAQVTELLQRQGRVSYRALQIRFHLDDDYLAGIKDELIDAQQVARDEAGKVLVWTGGAAVASSQLPVVSPQPPAPSSQPLDAEPRTSPAALSSGERRHLTVMFCDLVGSTALSERLDPEELREIVQTYQTACTGVIDRFAGYVAQYLGDGLLVYFGYPVAHEDDAQRAVRAGLEIVQALHELNTQLSHPLQVRIGIHTGPVVIGAIGGGKRQEQLALGEVPNVAARVQALAEPDTVVLSAVTHRLVAGLFECQEIGPRAMKGVSTPLALYRVIRESEAQSRFEAAIGAGLTPLVGRDLEVGLLRERWAQAQGGDGQVVLLSGEAGIGKSRLVQTLKEQVMAEGATRIEFRCSPYHQNSAFYPIIDHLQRLLQFHREESSQARLEKLQQTLARYRFPQADTVPLLAALLSLPQPADASPLTLSPQKQKQKTQEAFMAWIREEAERQVVYCVWEDLHWADPSTLDFLSLFLEQIPTSRLLAVLTFRPDFTPPWRSRSHIAQLTLNRLGRQPVEAMVAKITGGKSLPREVLRQIVAKTDGVPLFVEELTKMVVESGLLTAADDHYELTGPLPPLAIPSTLQDSLMARLDRLAATREIAQLGATLGREFSYELLQAISPLDEETFQQGLRQLVEAELLYQRGLPPQATYLFKHALVQDAAYQSLLKSKRQQLHQQVAQVLRERFAEITEAHPEILAHHYTEAGLLAQAIPYWQQAGERAAQRSANIEAIAHLGKGLELLKTLPDTPERAQQELTLQTTLGPVLIATKGFGSLEVEKTYTRARELCQQIGETPQLFLVLRGLWACYNTRAEYQTARELGEQCLRSAQNVQDPALLVEAHRALGRTLFDCGELTLARAHLEQGVALYDPQQHRSHAFLYGYDPGVAGLSFLALVLWHLGYPDQALKRIHESLALAQERAHPFSLAFSLFVGSTLQQRRRDIQATQERTRTLITISEEQGFPTFGGWGNIIRAWALAEQGGAEEGIAQMRQGMAAWQGTGAEMWQSHFLALLAEMYGKMGQVEEGFAALTEALAHIDRTGERYYEAEVYRLYGELALRIGEREKGRAGDEELFPHSPTLPHSSPETCFLKAIEIAQWQQAKSLELRAATSLARLWHQQGKSDEARSLLTPVYRWFTEGFDTKDLQEAKALLEELSH